MIQWAKFASKAKKIGSKAKGAAMKLKSKMTPTPEGVLGARAKMQTGIRKASYKTSKFVKKNKTAVLAAGAGAGAVGSYQVGSKRAERKTTTRAGIAIGSAYVLGKQSKIKGNYEINVAPKFRAVAVQPSKGGNKLRQHSSDKKFLKSLKDKKFQAVLAKRKK